MVTRKTLLGLRRILKLVPDRNLTLVVLADGDGADLLEVSCQFCVPFIPCSPAGVCIVQFLVPPTTRFCQTQIECDSIDFNVHRT
jgi:hypothetical protein